MKFFILAVFISPSIVLAQNAFTVEPPHPQVGDEIVIRYNPAAETAVLKNATKINLYSLHWAPEGDPVFHEYEMKQNGDEFQAIIHDLKENVSLLQVRFVSGEIFDDDNGSFWNIMFYDDYGHVTAESYHALARSYQLFPGHTDRLTDAGDKTNELRDASHPPAAPMRSIGDETQDQTATVLRSRFAEAMLNEEAPDFTLLRLDEGQINLNQLEGKVVVLDFWATWCGPCVSAFPYFQEVVNHFEDNPDVEFLAINSWEGELDDERYEKVNTFIDDNGYTFTVLMDAEDDVISDYEIQGIPTRITIGRDGNIRFRDIGFAGPSMTQSMIVQIEMLLEDDIYVLRE